MSSAGISPRRGFRISPLPDPVAVPQHLVAGMDGEFDEHRPLRNTEHLDTDVDDTPAKVGVEGSNPFARSPIENAQKPRKAAAFPERRTSKPEDR